jgi:hypothetical protein
MCIALTFNTIAGLQWGDWYRKGMDGVEQDILAGNPRAILAERHRPFLLHWDETQLATGIQMLHEAGIGPFAQMREDATTPQNSSYPAP